LPRDIFVLRFSDRHQSSFCAIFCKICDLFVVNSFAKLYFTAVGPFLLPLHQWMISLPFLKREKRRGEFDE
jgi:hypothetical protein